ncbi:hypothetical protein Q5P01_007105 [Channa striata]|uniref:TNFR-Cys domain-containing protein n=1 Tax=Channa striata TaxID=64152 RepID=A0AA88N312_CHASR|nr:hypothetical protein Q5P01_007105 [Channa striata]
MFSSLFVFGLVAAFAGPGRTCRTREFTTREGRCCPMCHEGLGLSVQQNCTATTDTVCGVLEGYFCKSLSDDGTGCSLADKHRHCPPGQSVKEAGTSRSDTECEDCQPGHFSEDGVNCTAWTVCSESQTKIREGSSMFDVVCEDETTTSVSSFTFISSFFNSTFWSSD